jgi:hypothetical protein
MIGITQANAMIIGSVLGDGHIQKTQSNTQKCRLRMAQSPDQKDYLYAKYEYLACLCPSSPKYDSNANTYHFYTYYTLDMKQYHDLFYTPIRLGKYKKIVQPKLKDYFFDPLSLAVWYCDDGSKRKDSNACRIATHSFSLEEIQCLQWILMENFQIPSHIVKGGVSKKGNYQWYVLSISARNGGFKKLKELIYPSISVLFPSMLYKLEQLKTP